MNNGLPEEYKGKIVDIAKIYNETINNIEIKYTYITDDNKRSTKTLSAKNSNFMHLCGISYYGDKEGEKNSNLFFKDCLAGTLRVEKIIYSNIDKVDMKLRILKHLGSLLRRGVTVCNNGVFEQLDFEGAIRTSRDIMALTTIKNGIPNSIIDLHTNKANGSSLKKNYRVIKIERFDKINNEKLPDIKFRFDKSRKKTQRAIRDNRKQRQNKSREEQS